MSVKHPTPRQRDLHNRVGIDGARIVGARGAAGTGPSTAEYRDWQVAFNNPGMPLLYHNPVRDSLRTRKGPL